MLRDKLAKTMECVEEKLIPYMEDERILQMKRFIQHGNTTTRDHAIRVARMAVMLDLLLPGNRDTDEICAAAVLHDYYLYDWHDHGDHLHGFHHPYIAAENAKRDFCVSDHVCSMIKSHMWPLNFLEVPKSRGAWLITFSDKFISIQETVGGRLHFNK